MESGGRQTLPRPSKMKLTSGSLQLSERDVTKQVKDFLEHRNWRPLRTQSGKFSNPSGQTFQIGEDGMADFEMVHYLKGIEAKPAGLSLVLWVEVKKPNARMSCTCEPHHNKTCRMHRQMKWRQREELRGAVVVKVDDIKNFEAFYNEHFGWLHTGVGTGQMDLFLAGVKG